MFRVFKINITANSDNTSVITPTPPPPPPRDNTFWAMEILSKQLPRGPGEAHEQAHNTVLNRVSLNKTIPGGVDAALLQTRGRV